MNLSSANTLFWLSCISLHINCQRHNAGAAVKKRFLDHVFYHGLSVHMLTIVAGGQENNTLLWKELRKSDFLNTESQTSATTQPSLWELGPKADVLASWSIFGSSKRCLSKVGKSDPICLLKNEISASHMYNSGCKTDHVVSINSLVLYVFFLNWCNLL